MKTVMISAFDAPFFHYADRMYDSVRAFHPELPLYAGDLGLTNAQRRLLEQKGVKVVLSDRTAVLRQNKLRLCFGDFLLWSFLKEVEYDQVLWIDADTLVLKRLDPALSLLSDRKPGVVGHPGRFAGGPIYTMGHRYEIAPGTTHREFIERWMSWDPAWPYIATGLWLTNEKFFLQRLDALVSDMIGLTDDSPVFSGLMNHMKLASCQLDPDTWNFSRQLVSRAKFVNGQIIFGNLKPFTVGFSITDSGQRLGSPEIDRFYEEVIVPKLPRQP